MVANFADANFSTQPFVYDARVLSKWVLVKLPYSVSECAAIPCMMHAVAVVLFPTSATELINNIGSANVITLQ